MGGLPIVLVFAVARVARLALRAGRIAADGLVYVRRAAADGLRGGQGGRTHGARPAGARGTLRNACGMTRRHTRHLRECKRTTASWRTALCSPSSERATRSHRHTVCQRRGNRHLLPYRQRCLRARRVAPLGRREAQGTRPRACEDTRASTSSLPQLSEQSERSERREFCGRPGDRASQGSLREAQTAPVKRRGGLAGAFAEARRKPNAMTSQAPLPKRA